MFDWNCHRSLWGQPHVTPDVSQLETAVIYTGKLRPWLSVSDARHAAWRGCEGTPVCVWQRCIAVTVGGTVGTSHPLQL
ncbi:hypothetical protein HaLaN_18125 [Haematococcus lacustris]|uniref:Uncharacterized protein n=1 Tax=Haematococcus lacustris TaxID=44745 RepID=A0A699ZR86_HAELA|nr:hypothetical protein HaLaN_18125 [Haematococcus lacustris]